MKKDLADHNHDKYITAPEFSAEDFDATLKQENLVTKTNFDNKMKTLNQKINWNKAKHLLVENELKKL